MKILHQISALLIVTVFLISPAIAQQNKWGAGVKGNGPIVEKNIQLENFDAIKLGISADVMLHKGNSQNITVKGQQNIIELLKKEVESGVWKIGFEENVSNYDKLTIHITIPTLKGVKISGSGDVKALDAFTTSGNFYADVHGSGDMSIQISAANINTSIAGSGNIDLKGKAKSLQAEIKGSGDLDASGLIAERCSVKINGSGDCKVNSSNELHVDIAGSGDVQYTGDPSVKSKVRGSGNVTKSK